MQSNTEVVKDYLGSFSKGDFKRVRSLLNDNLKFTGPMEQHESADSFLNSAKSHMGEVEFLPQIKEILSDDDSVGIRYEAFDGMRFSEWYKVSKGKINSIELYFDPRRWTN